MGLTLNRVAIALMVLVLGRSALYGLMMGNVFAMAVGAIGAAAYAANWPLAVSRPLRIAAFVIQMLMILVMIAAVALLLVLSDMDANDWADVPLWFWPIVAAIVFIIYKATAPGFALLKEAL